MIAEKTLSTQHTVFCYVCGKFIPLQTRRAFNENLKKIYKECFDREVKNLKEKWVPHKICDTCRKMLNIWDKNKQEDKHLKFSVLMLWTKPYQKEDCYFCMTEIKGFSGKSKHKIVYANVSSVTKPVEKIDDVDDVSFLERMSIDNNDDNNDSNVIENDNGNDDDSGKGDANHDDDNDVANDCGTSDVGDCDDSDDDVSDSDYENGEYLPSSEKNCQPETFIQEELNNLVRDLGLPKDGADFLLLFLKEKICYRKVPNQPSIETGKRTSGNISKKN